MRHVGWSLGGAVLPLAVGLLTVPTLLRELGAARFGLLGIAWAVLEYAAVADAGLGRATAHAIARASRHGAATFPAQAVTASLLAQVAFGAIVAGLCAFAVPTLVTQVLDVPTALREEAVDALLIAAATIPLVLLAVSLRLVLEAAERFDLAAAVRVPSTLATFIVPAVLAVAGATLPTILSALLAVRALTCLGGAALAARAVPGWRLERPRGWGPLRSLLTFGAWASVSALAAPLFLLLDRFVLGALHGVEAVGVYVAPFEVTVRLLVLPGAVAAALFARASAVHPVSGASALQLLHDTAMLPLLLTFAATAVGGLVVAPDLLAAWLRTPGAPGAPGASLALRLLLLGVALNALAHVPVALLYAAGRPDAVARGHLLELVVHAPATLLLVGRFGVAGAAAAWSLRAVLDAVIMFMAARRLLGVSPAAALAGRAWRIGIALALAVAPLALATAGDGAARAPLLAAAALAATLYVASVIVLVLRPTERQSLLVLLRGRRARTAR